MMTNETDKSIDDSRLTIDEAQLPKEMRGHTYGIMNRVEDTHWWFVGRRAILESFLDEIAGQGRREEERPTNFSLSDTEDRSQESGGGSQGSGETSHRRSADSTKHDDSGGDRSKGSSADSELSTQHSVLDTHHSSPRTHLSVPNEVSLLRILDVGCGTGANLEMLSRFGDAEGVDVSDEALTYCKQKGLKVGKGLAEELPFENETFDIVTGLDVVEHLDNDIEGLKEMNRVLVPGGRALLFVPAFMWLWGVQDDISHHRIRYTRSQIVERLKKAGFTVERATYANITFFAPILLGRILMRLTGFKPESENNVNISALNGLFGRIFSAERHFLKYFNLPLGVSIIVAARKSKGD